MTSTARISRKLWRAGGLKFRRGKMGERSLLGKGAEERIEIAGRRHENRFRWKKKKKTTRARRPPKGIRNQKTGKIKKGEFYGMRR